MKENTPMPDLKKAFRDTPPAFAAGVERTLDRLQNQKEEIPMKKKMSATLAVALIVTLLVAGTAFALEQFGITNFLNNWYGEKLTVEATGLIRTEFTNPTLKVGDITFTLREMMADAYVGMAVIECKAPEGKYIYTDLVQMTEEEWAMSEKDRIEKYGDYYWLLDTDVSFKAGDEKLYTIAEYAMGGDRESDNVIIMQCIFPVGSQRDVSTLDLSVAVRHVTSEDMSAGEKFEGDFIPGYQLDTSAYKTFKKTINNGTIKDVTITLTPLMLHADVTLEKASDEQHAVKITDKDGNEYEFTFLGSFGASSDAQVVTGACGIPETLPESVFVRLAQYDKETGDPIPVCDNVEIELK